MRKSVLLLLVLVVLAQAKKSLTLADSFEIFTQKYNKKYRNQSESMYRLKMFRENLMKIREAQKLNPEVKLGVNEFSDMSAEEFLARNTGYQPEGDQDLPENRLTLEEEDFEEHLLTEGGLDYTNYFTAPKRQNGCGACYSFATIAMLEGNYAIKTGKKQRFSEQAIIDCDPKNNGCSGGKITNALYTLVKGSGASKEEDYPFRGKTMNCTKDKSKAISVKWGKQLNLSRESDLKAALKKYGPIAISMYVDDQFVNYRGGVMSRGDIANHKPNHGMLLVGYGTDQNGTPYWKIRNSWGSWGESGYFRIKQGTTTLHKRAWAASF